MPSPGITLTATVKDLFGVAVGSAANPCKLSIALCGFGPVQPVITGSAVLGKVGPIFLESANGSFSTPLWGNDQITPSGTYYAISLIDGNGNVVQSDAYQFSGTATVDLSNAVPIVPPYGAPVSGLKTAVCTGSLPGTVYVAPGPILALYVNGLLQRPGTDYTLSASCLTATLNYTTESTDNVYAFCISY